jgi:hypothetical protein
MIRTEHPSRSAGANLTRHRHVGAFFRTPEEKYRILLPYMREGIERGEKAFYVVDPQLRYEHPKRLQAGGIDTPAEEEDRQLEVRSWPDAYLRDGHFDQASMLALIEEIFRAGQARDYRLTRLVAQMEWALEDVPGVNDLVEYETRLNFILPKYKDALICTYDYARFGAGVLMDIMRIHPSLLVGGVLQENPFFVPPGRFLQELRERGANRSRLTSYATGEALAAEEGMLTDDSEVLRIKTL